MLRGAPRGAPISSMGLARPERSGCGLGNKCKAYNILRRWVLGGVYTLDLSTPAPASSPMHNGRWTANGGNPARVGNTADKRAR